MKKLLPFMLIILIPIITFAQKRDFKKYLVKSGYVEYKMEGSASGIEKIWFDNYGDLELKQTQSEIKMLGIKQKTSRYTLSKGFNIWEWDTDSKTGTFMKNTLMEQFYNDPNFDMEQFGREMLEATGFKKTGSEVYDGKDCDLWEGMNSKIWAWKKNALAVRTEMNIVGTIVIAMTAFDGNPTFAPGTFDVPAGVKFTEQQMPDLDELQLQMEKAQEESAGEEVPDSIQKQLPDVKSLLKQFRKK